jgi:hypothetical protein
MGTYPATTATGDLHSLLSSVMGICRSERSAKMSAPSRRAFRGDLAICHTSNESPMRCLGASADNGVREGYRRAISPCLWFSNSAACCPAHSKRNLRIATFLCATILLQDNNAKSLDIADGQASLLTERQPVSTGVLSTDNESR